jgi:lipoprotein NlpD
MLAVPVMPSCRFRVLFAVLCVSALAACTTTSNRAPVVDHSPALGAVPPAPVNPPAAGPGYYTVKRGDTLYGIALQFGQDYRQLAQWNNLDATYRIHVDQVLRVAPPEANPAANGGMVVAPPPAGPGLTERPIGQAGAPAAGAPPGYAPQPGEVVTKTAPNGLKRPYSDQTLADMSRPDAETLAQAPSAPVVAAGAPAASAPPSDQPQGGDENVGWIWPAAGAAIAGFSEVGNKGVNIAGKSGAPVLAAGDGTVLYVGNGVRGYGNLVVVKHNPTYISVYAHNSKILVTEQQPVKKGQKIAEMGDSDADQVELHFEIRRQGKPVDPMKYLPPR